MEIYYDYDMVQLVMKIVLNCVNVPCNLILAFMWIYFWQMGKRFQGHFKKVDKNYKRNFGMVVISIVALGSLCQQVFQNVYFIYPTVMDYLGRECSQTYLNFEKFQIYYTVCIQPLQGIFMMFVIDLISKRALQQEENGDDEEETDASIRETDRELYNLEISELQ